jgi:hypothetical protein
MQASIASPQDQAEDRTMMRLTRKPSDNGALLPLSLAAFSCAAILPGWGMLRKRQRIER